MALAQHVQLPRPLHSLSLTTLRSEAVQIRCRGSRLEPLLAAALVLVATLVLVFVLVLLTAGDGLQRVCRLARRHRSLPASLHEGDHTARLQLCAVQFLPAGSAMCLYCRGCAALCERSCWCTVMIAGMRRRQDSPLCLTEQRRLHVPRLPRLAQQSMRHLKPFIEAGVAGLRSSIASPTTLVLLLGLQEAIKRLNSRP